MNNFYNSYLYCQLRYFRLNFDGYIIFCFCHFLNLKYFIFAISLFLKVSFYLYLSLVKLNLDPNDLHFSRISYE